MDARVKNLAAVAAKDRFVDFMNTLINRIEKQKSGLDQLPSNDEWNRFKHDAFTVLRELGEKHPKDSSRIEKDDLNRIVSRYPNVEWGKLPNAIIKVLEKNAAPFDLVRAHYQGVLSAATRDALQNVDTDAGLLWWALERAQWHPFSRDELTDGNWGRLGVLLQKFAKNTSNIEIQPGGSYAEIQTAKAQLSMAILNDLKNSGGYCRQAKDGANFAVQLGALWSFNCHVIQRKVLKFSHVLGGRFEVNGRDTPGGFLKEKRPPTEEDLRVLRKREKGRLRSEKYRAKKAGENSVTEPEKLAEEHLVRFKF